jgi:hypothetical protein
MYSIVLTSAVEGLRPLLHQTNRAQKKNYKFLRYIPINVAKANHDPVCTTSETDNK